MIADAPRDGTVILVEVMNYAGVPATGGHSFVKVKFETRPFSGWTEADRKNTHYGEECFLRWFPGNTDPATLTLTERTNWNFVPSNGTAGEIFYGENCANCIRERPVREDYDNACANGLGCNIYLRSMAYGIGDADYPTEWTYKPDGVPKCTAFERDTGQPTQEPRCTETIEMFPQGEIHGPATAT